MMPMQRPILALSAAVLLLVCAGCGGEGRSSGGGSGDMPAWVKQPPSEPGVLFAAGGAPKGQRDAAVAKAKREIGAQISVSVRAISQSEERSTTATGPGGERVERAWSEFREKIELEVAQEELPGITLVEEADARGEHWALVRFDRAAWAQDLRTRIADLDGKLTAERDRAKEAGNDLRATARAFRAVMPLAAQRTSLLNRLRTADPQGQLPPWPVDPAKLRAVLARLLAEVPLAVKVVGKDIDHEEREMLTARVQGALTKAGIAVTERDPVLAMELTPRLSRRDVKDATGAWTRFEAAVTAQVSAPADGKVVGTIEAKGMGMDKVKVQARDKALDKLAADLAAQIDSQMIELLAL
jgi:hypothetical protein